MQPTRPPISRSFVLEGKRQRIIHAFAELATEGGYEATKIGDIVRRAGVARKTLYECFEGKDAVASALVIKICPAAAGSVDLDDKNSALRMLAIELAIQCEAADQAGAIGEAEGKRADLRGLPGSITAATVTSGDPLLCLLPPGRHGLPREFVCKNQRHRLLDGLALSVAERGYRATTIAHVSKAASVSRRTFYEHFENKEEVAVALAVSVSTPAAVLLEGADLDRGWAAFVIEVVAAGVRNEVEAGRKVKEADHLLQTLVESFKGATSVGRMEAA